jgi:hypothetical protein
MRVVEEQVRVEFHLNGYTKVILERTIGVGLADGGVTWDISTNQIPKHLRAIGSRFVIRHVVGSPDIEIIDSNKAD